MGQKNIKIIPPSTVLDTHLFVEDVVLTKILDTDSMDSKWSDSNDTSLTWRVFFDSLKHLR